MHRTLSAGHEPRVSPVEVTDRPRASWAARFRATGWRHAQRQGGQGCRMTIGHDERHALLEQLDLLRARRREIEASLEVDDHRHDVGDQAEATERRDELDWIDRRIRDIVHLLWVAGLRDAVPERVGVGTLVRLRYTDGNVETVLVTAIPDEDIPEAFRYCGPLLVRLR